ncbi:uncharacterized protein TRAVEDRAFT_27932 [Trametes versicolor FP-101664 SS1]|uniref:uncharacterized protein n=1 Tax=Trametes versicolor (strain FP-101664) TaxID=717944 RepID=UPI0004621409|nr:uncharacterized protein TRAVEDRAFT_27932 [Trametes versicolor FP-101664 SS1]EIW60304.1 hypothetical protein TRAVEDRAFT_27932 [Trametes versicolor FP-101664 SS1]
MCGKAGLHRSLSIAFHRSSTPGRYAALRDSPGKWHRFESKYAKTKIRCHCVV